MKINFCFQKFLTRFTKNRLSMEELPEYGWDQDY